MSERARFENYCLLRGIEHRRLVINDVIFYYNMIANDLWDAWTAALKK